MENMISKKVQQIKPSATFAIAAKANKLRSMGKNIISLSQGEPDCDTPEEIKQHAIQAISEGFTKYTAIDGILELKEAIQQKFINDNNLNYNLDQIIVSTGAKQAIFNALSAILNPADEVIIIAPYWVSYPEMIKLASGTPKIVQTSIKNNFKLAPKDLEQAINDKTRLILLNSPSNPSGINYSKEDLQEIGKILNKYPKVMILSDDIYEHTIWDGSFNNIATACPELIDRTIVINGVSKAYSMTGWRIGYAAGPAELIKAMKIVQSQSTSCPNSIAQKAALGALKLPNSIIKEMVSNFQKRHDWLYPALQEIQGIEVIPSQGTFYSFPNISTILEKYNFKDDVEFCDRLLEEADLALVPGTAFGNNQHIRISFCIDDKVIKEAIQRLHSFISSLD
ncbi:MAG: pyridoxal phosphate-dependent aminotransferase [Legionellales bacterium]|nr:pyridoxal phosphate-dependent aminotransferase [Legionellales bacterium]